MKNRDLFFGIVCVKSHEGGPIGGMILFKGIVSCSEVFGCLVVEQFCPLCGMEVSYTP